jgi:putative two-component system response regulator
LKNKATILIVDDEKINLDVMEAMLIPQGYEIIIAQNGIEALNKANENEPDVILLDIMMPGMNGFEVAKQLKQNEETKVIPIVMVTALSEVQDRVKALEAGADDFLTKPVDDIELRARVSSLLKVKAYNDHMKNYQKELEDEVAKRTIQLKQAFEKIKKSSMDTIYSLTRAAEYRDTDTGAHIMRMSHYSAALARKMGINENTVEFILYAAPMHDVGKIGIPDKILLKPGKHDPEEWGIMKEHTVIGGEILEGSSTGFAKLGKMIALTHHEKWDGSGYPKGLKGREIPKIGRVTALADVFDALTSKRPYKAAFSMEESLNIINAGKGKHFDPEVVDAFLSTQSEILAIKERFKDSDVN